MHRRTRAKKAFSSGRAGRLMAVKERFDRVGKALARAPSSARLERNDVVLRMQDALDLSGERREGMFLLGVEFVPVIG